MKKLFLLALSFTLLFSCSSEEKATKPKEKPVVVIGTDLGDGYSQDSVKIYYQGKEVEVAQAATFEVLGGGYAKDNFSAYYNGKEVQGAQGKTFQWVSGDTARDVEDLYIKGAQQPLKK